jgi:hypothetical protein
MAQLVNIRELQLALTDLGWNVPREALKGWMEENNVPPAHLRAYLRAFAANRGSVIDDQDIVGCPAVSANKITTMLRNRHLVG